MRKSILVTVIIALLSPELFAADYTGQNSYGSVNFVTSGSYGSDGDSMVKNYVRFPLNATVDASIDWDAETFQYNSMILSSPGGTVTLESDFTVGPGETRTITTVLDIAPISLEAYNVEPMDLIPTIGGNYTIDNPFQPSGGFEDLSLTGSYTMSGPSESKAGTFSIAIEPLVSPFMFDYNLDTAGYPSELLLKSAGQTGFHDHTPLLNVLVDDIDIEIFVEARKMGYLLETGTVILIPEPSTLFLLGLGGLLIRRRKKA